MKCAYHIKWCDKWHRGGANHPHYSVISTPTMSFITPFDMVCTLYFTVKIKGRMSFQGSNIIHTHCYIITNCISYVHVMPESIYSAVYMCVAITHAH